MIASSRPVYARPSIIDHNIDVRIGSAINDVIFAISFSMTMTVKFTLKCLWIKLRYFVIVNDTTLKNKFIVSGSTLTLIFFCQCAIAQIDMTEELHHKIVFENETVRISDLKIPDGDTTIIHRHRKASAVIFLSASQCVIQDAGKAPVATAVTPGTTIYRAYDEKPVVHKVWTGDHSFFRCLVVELLKAKSLSSDCATSSEFNSLWQQNLMHAASVKIPAGKKIHLEENSCTQILIVASGSVMENKLEMTSGNFQIITNKLDIIGKDKESLCILLQIKK